MKRRPLGLEHNGFFRLLRCRPQRAPFNSLRQFFPLRRFARAGHEVCGSQTSQRQRYGAPSPIPIGSFRGASVRGLVIASGEAGTQAGR